MQGGTDRSWQHEHMLTVDLDIGGRLAERAWLGVARPKRGSSVSACGDRAVVGLARPALSRARPKRAETHGDRDPKAKRAKSVPCTLFKAMPRPPNSEVKVRPTSLIQGPCHQLARETPGATKERLG